MALNDKSRINTSNPYEVCVICGKHIWRDEQAYVFKEQIVCHECYAKLRSRKSDARVFSNNDQSDARVFSNDDQSDVCCFCNNNQSDRDSCFKQLMSKVFEKGSAVFELILNGRFDQTSHGVVLSREGFLKQVSASYVVSNEEVPRCKECRSRHKRHDLFKSILFGSFILCGAIVGLFIGARLILRAGDYRFNTVMAGIILTLGLILLGIMAGALIGAIAHILFMIIAPYSTLKGTQSTKKIKVFPRIKQLIDNGWRLRVAPPLTQGLSSIEIPTIGNEVIFRQVAEKIGLDYIPYSLNLIASLEDKARDKQTTDFNRFGPIGGFLIFMIGLVVVFYVRAGFRQLFEGLEHKETVEFRQRIREIMPADPDYNLQGELERNYLDPVHGFFEARVPPTANVGADMIEKTIKLPLGSQYAGKVVPCSRIKIQSPHWYLSIRARKTFSSTVDLQEFERVARRISKLMRISSARKIKIDGVEGAEVFGEALGELFHIVKYKKDGLDHTCSFHCPWKNSSIAQHEFISFLRAYKSCSLEESSGTPPSPEGEGL